MDKEKLYKSRNCKHEIILGDAETMVYVGCKLRLEQQNKKCEINCLNYEMKCIKEEK